MSAGGEPLRDTLRDNVAPRPRDARLARIVVRPLLGTWVRPNHLTALRLGVGLCGVLLLARGGYLCSNVGMALVVVANFLDHTDGALARMGGYVSRVGHFFDLAVDSLITVLLFVAVGYALTSGSLGNFALLLGFLAGLSVSAIFYLRMRIEEQDGKAGTRQPQWSGFEVEDVLYLLPLVSLFAVEAPFIVVAAIGAPVFALWVLRDYLRVFGRRATDLSPHL
ncbi:MAG TPA: CDP-alcohol phosphatidyltransferase family protein [Nevskiaceae bacterium]|nr:CDP-alcohol phosphatidyltransferase family protein [Nevskiaceae bacterium]